MCRGSFAREAQDRQRLVHVFAADHVHDETRLLRRTSQILCTRCCFHPVLVKRLSKQLTVNHGFYSGPPATLLDFSTFVPEWPLNVRVGANSPSLWPTVF